MDAKGNNKSDLLPGTLEMLILKTLARFGPMHGYAIAKSIEQVSEDALGVEEGSLYPALQRMLLREWLTAEWVPAGPKRRARVYQLTPEGRAQLDAEIARFRRLVDGVVRVIQPA